MIDLIDRYELIELLKKMRHEADSKWEREMITTVEDKINAMPSAEPILHIKWAAISQLKELGYGFEEKPKRGKWIPCTVEDDGATFTGCKCSLCNYWKPMSIWNYCPNCGADMRDGKGEKNE